MAPFLESIARAYFDNEADSLFEYCFVFPNKRSALYFMDYMNRIARENGRPLLLPATTTIVDLIESFSDSAPGDRLELIFILYNVYCNVIKRRNGAEKADTIDFNRFVQWADVLLNDFDDVDDAMADPAELFRNVGNLKEISANYLTPEQIDVIRHYWSDEKIPAEVKEFWNHVAHPASDSGASTSVSMGFLRLWQVMFEIYSEFTERLEAAALHTRGMAVRNAVRILNETTPDALPFRRYIFIGFNSPSNAEKAIFSRLQDMRHESTSEPLADFYWDLSSPAFAGHMLDAANIVERYAKDYPPLYDCVPPIPDYPSIEVIGIPSRVGQAKTVGKLLDALYPADQELTAEVLRETAVVLPEETMLTPLLVAIPERVNPLNITMGYKLRNTAVSGLIRDIVTMHMRSYQSKARRTFFYEDVIKVLSHPVVRSFSPALSTAMVMEIQRLRLFNIPEDFFDTEERASLKSIFRFISDKNDAAEVFSYLNNLICWLKQVVKSRLISDGEADPATADVNEADTPENAAIDLDANDTDNETLQHAAVASDQDHNRAAILQEAFLRRYSDALARLEALCRQYLYSGKIYIENATVFNLVEKILQGEMLNFEGLPMQGLQIMGVLEARALDFRNIIIPSMNERLFPRARFTASFIPPVLRSAYGLSTPEQHENAYAYFFYRMISRAEKVYLLYDARSLSRKTQMSRYINQLIHLFRPKKLSVKVLPYSAASFNMPKIEVAKTPAIMARLNRYRSAEHPLFLSASSIKLYLGCPMSFYFEMVARYRREDKNNEWIDESTFGTIVHDVFEKLFDLQLEKSSGGALITSDVLESMRSDRILLDRLICRAVNEFFRNLGKECYTPLNGETKIIGYIIRENVREVLRKEQQLTPFVYLHGEWQKDGVLRLQGSEGKAFSVNFTCRVDRVDMLKDASTFERMRIIDYKTGSDEIHAPGIEAMLHDYKCKAFAQVMLYSQAYAQFLPYSGPIQPMVYSMRKLMVQPVSPLTTGQQPTSEQIEHEEYKSPDKSSKRWKILDYRDYLTEFNDALIPYLEELFNPDVPFVCADDDAACTYCEFKEICQRHLKK